MHADKKKKKNETNGAAGGLRAPSRSLILFGADSLSCVACLSTSFWATSSRWCPHSEQGFCRTWRSGMISFDLTGNQEKSLGTQWVEKLGQTTHWMMTGLHTSVCVSVCDWMHQQTALLHVSADSQLLGCQITALDVAWSEPCFASLRFLSYLKNHVAHYLSFNPLKLLIWKFMHSSKDCAFFGMQILQCKYTNSLLENLTSTEQCLNIWALQHHSFLFNQNLAVFISLLKTSTTKLTWHCSSSVEPRQRLTSALTTITCIVWMTYGVGYCGYFLPLVALTVFFASYAQQAAVNTVDDHPKGFMQGKEYQRLVLVRH